MVVAVMHWRNPLTLVGAAAITSALECVRVTSNEASPQTDKACSVAAPFAGSWRALVNQSPGDRGTV